LPQLIKKKKVKMEIIWKQQENLVPEADVTSFDQMWCQTSWYEFTWFDILTSSKSSVSVLTVGLTQTHLPCGKICCTWCTCEKRKLQAVWQ
jgi:hypothetical protein